MPLGYLDFNGRPFGMTVIASGHQEATLIKVQSAWEATFPARQPPPYEVLSYAVQGLGDIKLRGHPRSVSSSRCDGSCVASQIWVGSNTRVSE